MNVLNVIVGRKSYDVQFNLVGDNLTILSINGIMRGALRASFADKAHSELAKLLEIDSE